MSQRYTGLTPADNPKAFKRIPFKDVRTGDLFQGKKNRRKWYTNTNPRQKERGYVYFRPIAGVATKAAGSVAPSRDQIVSIMKKELRPVIRELVLAEMKKARFTSRVI